MGQTKAGEGGEETVPLKRTCGGKGERARQSHCGGAQGCVPVGFQQQQVGVGWQEQGEVTSEGKWGPCCWNADAVVGLGRGAEDLPGLQRISGCCVDAECGWKPGDGF